MSPGFLGQISWMAYPVVPRGWLPCEGQLLPISTNSALYALLGTRFGGDGHTNFALPDLRGRVPVGIGPGSNLPTLQLGDSGGQASVTLQGTEVPAHTHALQAVSDLAGTANPAGALPAAKGRGGLAMFGPAGSANTTLSPAAVSSTGLGQAHPNMQPTAVLRACIATQGIFPSPP